MSEKFRYITSYYKSNCFIEAIKAKIKNPKIKIYFCRPRHTENNNFQMCHFMWSDDINSYDFSDDQKEPLPIYKCFYFKGRIRKFHKNFAEEYAKYRNKKGR